MMLVLLLLMVVGGEDIFHSVLLIFALNVKWKVVADGVVVVSFVSQLVLITSNSRIFGEKQSKCKNW